MPRHRGCRSRRRSISSTSATRASSSPTWRTGSRRRIATSTSPGVEDAGPRLRQLVEAFVARSASEGSGAEAAEVGLIEQFEEAAAPFTRELGSIIVLDDADERLTLERDGRFVAEVVPEGDETSWRTLRTRKQLTEFYSPEELFQALAEKLAVAFRSPSDAGAEVAAAALHDLALAWREQSLDAEARLFAEFNRASAGLPADDGRVRDRRR